MCRVHCASEATEKPFALTIPSERFGKPPLVRYVHLRRQRPPSVVALVALLSPERVDSGSLLLTSPPAPGWPGSARTGCPRAGTTGSRRPSRPRTAGSLSTASGTPARPQGQAPRTVQLGTVSCASGKEASSAKATVARPSLVALLPDAWKREAGCLPGLPRLVRTSARLQVTLAADPSARSSTNDPDVPSAAAPVPLAAASVAGAEPTAASKQRFARS